MPSFSCKWYWIILFCSPLFVGAQELIVTYDLINEDDGMRNHYVHDVMMDSRGLIWMATNDGLHSYDGYSFTVYDDQLESPALLTSNKINSLAEDAEGNIWMGTDNGINVLNPSAQHVVSYFNSGNSTYPRGSEDSRQWKVLKDHKGIIWILEGGYLGQFVNNQFEYYRKDSISEISEIYLDWDNSLYIQSISQNTIILQNGEINIIAPYIDSGGEAIRFLGYTVYNNEEMELRSVHFDKQVYSYNLQSKKIVNSQPEANTIGDIIIKLLGNELDLNYPILGKAQNNIVYKIPKVMRDEGGLFWIATNLGIVKVAIRPSNFYSIDTLKNRSLRGMHEQMDGSIYIGAYAPFNFFKFDPVKKSTKRYDILNVWDVKPFNSDTLILMCDGSFSDIHLFDINLQKSVYEANNRNLFNYIRAALVLPNRKIIIGAEQYGLYIAPIDGLDQLAPLHISSQDSSLAQVRVNCLHAESDSVFWVGSTNEIIRINWVKGTSKHYEIPDSDSRRTFHQEVFHMYQNKKGAFWLATTNGLTYFEPKTNMAKTYTSRDGLPDNLIYCIQPEDSSVLWLSTQNGLSRMDISEQEFYNFSEADGISYREFNRNSSLRCKNGQLFFGGINGFTAFNPKDIQKERLDFRPFISSYAFYDREKNKLVEYIPSAKDGQIIKLDPDNRNITFTIGITDYSNPVKASFEVQLKGFDKDWIRLGNKRVVSYTNLNSGNYSFQVRAANPDGQWSEKEVSLGLVVKEPYYTSVWFYGLATLIIFLAISSFFYFRLIYERKSNRLRNRIANDLHDEVSNTLNNIRIAANEVQQSNKEASSKTISRIKQMSSSAIEHVEDVIWAIDQEKKSIKFLLFRMEDNIDELIRSRQIPIKFEKINLNDRTELNFLHRRNLLLIFKEALSNIIKHTYPERVFVTIGNLNGKFVLSVGNHFTNKKDSTYKTGRGTYSMKQRAAALKGKLIIEEREGSYEVVLSLDKKI